MSIRLIDLHTDWLLQYAPEATVFDPGLYGDVPGRLGQAEGYLQTTWAAVLACYRRAEDWARQADPWAALGTLVTRIEAEFCGRLLIGPEDHARWIDDPRGLCWGMIGVEGFDFLIRSAADLERLPLLFERGVRLFQPVYGPENALAGSAAPGDDRGLTDLGRAFLRTLLDLAPAGAGPRPILDLAHLNPSACAEVLDWFEADADRPRRLPIAYSHGAPRHDGFTKPRALAPESLARLRALGGTVGFGVGPPFFAAPDELRRGIEAAAALPYLGRPGFEGIALGTDFLGVDRTLPGLANAEEVVAWVHFAFAPDVARALIRDNARRLLARASGVTEAAPPLTLPPG